MKPPRWPGPQQANSRIVGGHVVRYLCGVQEAGVQVQEETWRDTQRDTEVEESAFLGRSYVPFSGCHKATLQPNIFLKLA